ncbi:MAG: oligosaccharide flippase family protein [Bacteroides sp.]|nr:oligosaccharide flippase family protein [Alistipes timonensis]MCM1311162.1 oligosaccharide flippase family protein [Bacteroides sp.]MCM1405581.1 oligosaccharide flippase family protein [[Clostridium] fimetarium]
MDTGHKRVVKNTLYLYIRQGIVLVLGLLTTRIVLDKLGVENYGIYSVVGSFVSMFTILNSVLQSATRRYLSLAIGKENDAAIKDTFQTAVVIHIWIAALVVLALETGGLWFLNNKLNIEASRMWAANWVFQFSVLSVAINILNTPYVASVTSHERFDVYAYLSIFDIVGKIVILFLLVLLPFDKLIVYAALMFAVAALVAGVYMRFCIKQFSETRSISLIVDKPLLKEMLKFSGWDCFGNITSIVNVQGITILLNIFFGTLVNAARGVATTVTFTVLQFVSGFVMAAEPQLVKSYAKGDYGRMEKLVFDISQMTLFMLAIFAVPIWMEMDYVLHLWLGDNVPEYTGIFIKITLLNCFISYSNLMVVKAIVATGNVKQLNLFLAPIELFILPIIYITLKISNSPVMVYWISALPSLMKFMVNLSLLRKFIGFPMWRYIRVVFLKNLGVVALALLLPLLVHSVMPDGLLRFLAVGSTSLVCTLTLMWFLVLNRDIKQMALNKLRSRLNFANK